MLFHLELDMYGFVGLVMLIGIVKKNAIMMIDFAIEAQRKASRSPAEAIYEAALIRFRPIMMTTMAALMGTLPIALGLGAGAEARKPLGPGGGGRAARVAGADALHHARGLHLPRAVPGLAAPGPAPAPPAWRDRRTWPRHAVARRVSGEGQYLHAFPTLWLPFRQSRKISAARLALFAPGPAPWPIMVYDPRHQARR